MFAPSPGLTIETDLALRRPPARPGTGTRSTWASTPAPTSTRRSTGSPARICPTTPATPSRADASSARPASSTSTPRVAPTPTSCSRPSASWPGRPSTAASRAGAWVLLRTDWSKRTDPADFLNVDADGPHTPGLQPGGLGAPGPTSATSWASASRRSAPTPGRPAASIPPSPTTTPCTAPGKFGLASLCNLDQLPPTGAVVIAAPLKIVDGSGSPLRVLAIVARQP